MTVILLFITFLISQPAYTQTSFGYVKFSPKEINSDIDYLLETTASVHPNIFSNLDSITFWGCKDSIMAQITEPINKKQFFKLTAPLIAKIGDAHTVLDLPWNDWDKYIKNGGLYFPFKVAWLNGLIIKKSDNNIIKPGSRLSYVNGLQCDSLFNEFMTYRGSEQINYSRFIIESYFSYYLWINNIIPPFELIISTHSDEMDTLLVNGIAGNGNSSLSPYYSYIRLDDNIGYIDWRRMRNQNNEPFDDFLERAFTDMRTHQSKGLIVDLRKCSGGNNDFGNMLLDYITDKPFRMSAEKHWKVSSHYRDYFRSQIPWLMRWITYPPVVWLGGLFSDELKMFTYDDGEIIYIHNDEYSSGSNELRFTGKVCFLIGSATFSSGVDLANAVQDYNIAPLFEQETGGVPNAFGNSFHFNLPCTGLGVGVSSARFIKADGDSLYEGGIKPEYSVSPSLAYLISANDIVLETALKWIVDYTSN